MSKFEQLSKLKELLDAGILSQDEFDAEKKKILETPSEAVSPLPPPSSKPGLFGRDVGQQRAAHEKQSSIGQQQIVGAIGGVRVAIFACMIIFFAMLFGWSGVKAGIENLWGR